MKRTMPQIILLNHGSTVNRKRLDNQMEADKKTKELRDRAEARNPKIIGDRTLEDLTTDQQMNYYGTWGADD